MRAAGRGALALVAVGLVALGCGGSPPATRDELMNPETCRGCHPEHFRAWAGSMHAYAADDPVFLAMNRRGQRETNGALGPACVRCHAPLAVREGATHDGLNLASVPAALKGVTCYFCHTVDAVNGTHDNPLHLSNGTTLLGELKDGLTNGVHGMGYSTLHDRDQAASAQLCGSCHDIVNRHGAAIERTYVEWQASVFSQLGGGATCSQCHMPQSVTQRPIASVAGAPPRRLHSHEFVGVDVALTPFADAATQTQNVQDFLNTSLQTALCVAPLGDVATLRVIIDNVGAGHSWPSGAAQDRRAWTEVIAYKNGAVIFQSGVVADGTAVSSADDRSLWLLRDCMFDATGKPVNMFWEAASFEANVLPTLMTFDQTDPRYYQTHIVQTFPRGPSTFLSAIPDRVTLRVRLQPVGLDVLDDLIATGDLDPAVRDRMPTFDVGTEALLEWTDATATAHYVESGVTVKCVTHTNLNVIADKVRAADQTRCGP